MVKTPWRYSEVELLIENYETKTTDELMELIPGDIPKLSF